ncbi:MAG: chemotaxis protein CheB [Opitutaceae bacterium]
MKSLGAGAAPVPVCSTDIRREVAKRGGLRQPLIWRSSEQTAPLPVTWAKHGSAVEPGNVCVAPPNKCLSVKDGVLLLHEADRRKLGGDVDYFFNSLAADGKHRAVGVVLSGNGSADCGGDRVVDVEGG